MPLKVAPFTVTALYPAVLGGSVLEAVLDMLYGPLFFRMLVGHQTLTPAIAGELVDTIFDGIASAPG